METITRTRTTGTIVSRNVEDLENLNVSTDLVNTGKRHQMVTPIEVNQMLQNVFADNASGGLAFLDSIHGDANKIIIQPVDIERNGGDSSIKQDQNITSFGRWSHWGKGNTEYKAEIPVEIYKEIDGKRELQTLARGNGQYALSISGSVAQRRAFNVSLFGWELQCLNGMSGTFEFFKVSHKHTKNLNIREMLIKGLNQASQVYNGLNNDIIQLQQTVVTPQNLAMFFHSGIMNNILSGSNVKEITGYYNDLNNPWFRNKDQSAYRLFNACTLFGEKQNSSEVKAKLQSQLYWPLNDAGLFNLPAGIKYPTNFKTLNSQPVQDSGLVETNQIEIAESEYTAIS
jgi:hypothetical protein